MVQFSKLRLSGFKSFVDATEITIGDGLTGIVGPNGCGKSNLVEALRWAMGETSAKRMRGGEMDDVIFNGTAARPQRNFAEVTITIDNSQRTAPAELNDADWLEIVRKIERGEGSSYRVNGKPVRAKDVQLLFADVSIGAHSPALVSQGRIADIINAKPKNRRLVLEEAAGITGLHARRHEAELKLRAAETNLTRVEDVLGAMDTQLQALKKQARQASRYRNLSEHIQKAEAALLGLRWRDAEDAMQKARAAFDEAEARVREHMGEVTRLTTQQTEKAATLPELREREAEAAAVLQRLKIAREALDAEEQKIRDAQEDARRILAQIESDIAHERRQSGEAQDHIGRLEAEAEAIRNSEDDYALRVSEAVALREKSKAIVEALDAELSQLTEETAANEARHSTLARQKAQMQQRLEAVRGKISDLRGQYAVLAENLPSLPAIEAAENEVRKAEVSADQQKSALQASSERREEAEKSQAAAQEEMQAAQAELTRLQAEADALQKLLVRSEAAGEFAPVLDDVSVNAGFEKALAVALGDDLQAALDAAASAYWRALPALDAAACALPEGVETLASQVRAPAALARALSQIGIVENRAEAERLVEGLKPGQCLVTRDGAAWRWDGLVISENAANPSAVRLEHKNRLETVRTQIATASAAVEGRQQVLDSARAALELARSDERDARARLHGAESVLADLRGRHNRIVLESAESKSRLSAIEEAISGSEEEATRLDEQLQQADRDLAALPDQADARERLLNLRAQLSERRGDFSASQSQLDRIEREIEDRRRRLETIGHEVESWQQRRERIETRIQEFQSRARAAEETLEKLSSRPGEIERERGALFTQLEEAERNRAAAADRLAQADNALREIQSALKGVEALLADMREARALAQATVAATQQSQADLVAQVSEKFGVAPSELAGKFDIAPDDMSDMDQVRGRLERLLKERDNMGPVNLRAEVEADEITAEMTKIQGERDELVEAIDKLRQGISKLNREARERLLGAFDKVNAHFQELFTRLFNGGRAYLELTEADDPLEAGLEIFAQPPGKKLQVLSLLSGGEQTLTSIALIFAMFLTNPAPICVLDEIDAPLDDSNVDRVCSLLEDMAKSAQTRFLVITHHRMTMARMHRLYGVTMREKGVSQLVSVDLRQRDLLDAAA